MPFLWAVVDIAMPILAVEVGLALWREPERLLGPGSLE